ncbi:MAG TPA: sugar-binding domain-containing protein [Pseudonocardiaceae bacterium]|jgi:DNA-binding transcriptional regulator LsrR (DeoR family)|nr:sugar-binding domain-containing protein [Pseudonocardiaceae bacterium]
MSIDSLDEMSGWGPAQNLLAASVARRFHLDGRTKVQIADEFGISRFKVARLLDAALSRGLVEVRISLPDPLDLELSGALREAYGLRRALVLQRGPGQDKTDPVLALRRRLGAMAAELLTETITASDVLGLAWGRTVNAMVESLHVLAPCSVVQLCGVYSRMDLHDSSVETVSRAATLAGGPGYPIYAPLILPDRRTAETLRRQPGVADAFEHFDRITTAVMAIGAWEPGQSTVYDVLDPKARTALGQHGVTAELAARLFDADGRALSTGLAHYVLAIETEQLRRVPEVIALAGGTAKATAIDAVLRSGLITTLVIDADTAELLIGLVATRPPANPATDRLAPPPK